MEFKKGKILLVLLPFWDPQIPPSGISCLKSFLQNREFEVKGVDANVEEELNEMYHRYFNTLKEYVIEEQRGNFNKVAYDVIRHHMMAYLNHNDQNQYFEAVNQVIHNTFYVEIGTEHFLSLHNIITEFYSRLQRFFLNLLEREKPSVLGISVYGGTLPASLFAFRLTREKYPHIMTVMGGGIFADILAPGSPNLEKFIQDTPYIDKFIIGEGEILLLKLLQGELDDSLKIYTLKDINNETLDISTVEPPDFSDFQLNYYPTLFTYTSRSCPYRCRFCTETNQWGRYRKKSSIQVVKEFRKLYDTHGIQLFLLGDSLLNFTVTGIAEEMISAGLSIYWDGYLRVDKNTCDPEKTMQWRRGGLYRVRLGMESGSQRILNLMQKEITIEKMKDAVSSLAYAGIKTTTYWVVGYPGETEEDFLKTLSFLEESCDDLYEADCSPFWFHYTNQGGANEWVKKSIPLYSPEHLELLAMQTWIVDCEPNRKEIHRRMWRFVEHCNKLGIPNPYSLHEIYSADERWEKLHKNAVPPLIEFKNAENKIEENKNLKELLSANVNIPQDDNDFIF